MSLLERIADARKDVSRSNIDSWISDYLIPSTFGFNGNLYQTGLGLNDTYSSMRVREISTTLPAYSQALRGSVPAFAAEMVRALVLSQARFTFRNSQLSRTPGRRFGSQALGLLEKPWPNATSGELLSRMEWHAGLAGNSFVLRRGGRLRVLRPDWTALLHGSMMEPNDAGGAIDGELIGYVYQNGGIGNPDTEPHTLQPDEVAHWSPIPDPLSPGMGMSWITPAIRDIQGDSAATEHKLKFFTNGATPNLVVKGIPAATKGQFDELVDAMEERHAGAANAYRTLYLTAGADATVIGADLRQIDFKSTQAAGENRITVLSRVPASLLGISEGLAGSSLNEGNFSAARRSFGDTWVFPMLQDVCAALSSITSVPSDAELWFDTSGIPILREDAKDAAEIAQIQGSTIRQLIDGGFAPDSVIAAVSSQDMSLLKHTGLLSIQLQPPGLPPPTTPQASTQGAS